ncbi:MAG: hypothetical protein V3T02_08430 [Alphaproteobacteria bacterium]
MSLGACREDEQGRVLLFNKGVYLGKADTDITADVRRALGHRIQRQASGGAGTSGGGASGSATPPNIRPPASTPIDALRERLRHQSGN